MEGRDRETRSAFVGRGGEPYRERNMIMKDGKMTLAGLILARTRWRREVNLVRELIVEHEHVLMEAEERREGGPVRAANGRSRKKGK